jgi:hypothetical protein
VRIIDSYRSNYSNSCRSANINLGWIMDSGSANNGVPFDPAIAGCAVVANPFSLQYDNILMTMVVTEVYKLQQRHAAGLSVLRCCGSSAGVRTNAARSIPGNHA